MFYIREKIDQLLKNLYIIELIFQFFNLDRTPKNFWVQGHYRIKTPELLKIESKLKHFKRNKVNIVLVSGGDGKILENIWGNSTGKSTKEHWGCTSHAWSFPGSLVESPDRLWIIFKSGLTFP